MAESDEPRRKGRPGDQAVDRLDETASVDPNTRPAVPRIAIEGYDIIRELHRGGQGVVYEAVQRSTKRKVAIKVLLEGRFASSSARRRFQREVALAAGLKHPNIIAIFDSGETSDGHQYCVMDYVRGRSIRSHIHHAQLSLEETLELFCAVCDAAHFAHQKGVIHRDLKPSNIFVDSDGVPRVLDFGLAKQLAGGEASLVSMTGQVMGTLPYMSPEQTRGNPDEIDARSDVYSLGVVLYELLTGRHPYPVDGDMLEVAKHITETEPTPPSKVWNAESGVSKRKSGKLRPKHCPIDDELQTIVLTVLSKERERRYQSADALRQDISRYLRGEPIEAKRDSSLYVIKKALKRNRARLAVAAGFVVVAAVALYVGSRTAAPPAPTGVSEAPVTSLAVLPLENLSGDPDEEYFADGMTGQLITTLGKIKALKVIARMSVMEYKNTSKLPSEIGRELGVDALVQGRVARFDDRVRITANLIRAATSEQLWGDSYERDMSDILAVQGEIARAITGEIQLTLTASEQELLASSAPVNPEAYQAYLRGVDYDLGADLSEEQRRLAVAMFQRAVELDPSFAEAHAALAKSHAGMFHYGYDRTEKRAGMAKSAVDRATDLQPDLPEVHVALGWYYYWCGRDYEKALTAFAIAKEGLPNNSMIAAGIGYIKRRSGHFQEALDHLRHALELSPRNQQITSQIAQTLMLLRDYQNAEHYFTQSISLRPDQSFSYVWGATNHLLWTGALRQARSLFERMPVTHDTYSTHGWASLEQLERDYDAVLNRLAAASADWVVDHYRHYPKTLLQGWIYQLKGESENARTALDAARILLEKTVQTAPDDDRIHSSLGIAYAMSGRTEDAIREGELGVQLMPVSRDALIGPARVEDLAFILTLVGEHEAAVDRIEYLLSIPSWISAPMLRLDPRWDPLRDHPRYEALMRRHGFEPDPDPQSERRPTVAEPDNDTIRLAVLPFRDQSPDPQEWFSGSMTTELISALSRIKTLAPTSFTSVMQYTDTAKSSQQIARERGVAKLIEGDVLRIGDRWRITVRLFDAMTDRLLWTRTYTRDGRDVHAMQSDIVRDVAQQVEATLTPAEESRLADVRQVNVEAYDLYLKGKYYHYLWTDEGFRKAIEAFNQAIALDPTLADARAGLAEVYLWIGILTGGNQEMYSKAMHAATEALALDDTLGLAHATLGYVKFIVDWDWHGCEEALRRGLELSPNSAHVHFIHGFYLVLSGRFAEGIAEYRRAVELDSVQHRYHEGLAWSYMMARRHDEAVAEFQELAAKRPADLFYRKAIAVNYAAKGRYEKALAECARLGGCQGEPAWVYAVAGRRQEALEEIARLKESPGVNSWAIACIYAGLGEKDDAFEWLDKVYQDHNPMALWFPIAIKLDPLRDDPRFDELLRRPGVRPGAQQQVTKDRDVATPPDDRVRLAVLPFTDLSPDPQEWRSDGIASELSATLGQIKAISVQGWVSARQFRDKATPLPQIARELNVNMLVDGRVQQVGGRVQITVELLDALTGTQLWSNTYQREDRDVLALQNEVVRAIADEIRVELTPDDRIRLTTATPVDPEAYEAYQLGRHFFARWDPVAARKSIEHFEDAVEKDPTFAAAYAGLAFTCSTLGVSEPEVLVKAEAAAVRALELDDTIAEAHVALGQVRLIQEWDWEGAGQALRRALELNPNSSEAHLAYGAFCITIGRLEEGIAAAERGRKLDPLSGFANVGLGWVYHKARQFDKAIIQFRKVLQWDPDNSYARMQLAWAYALKGNYEEALAEYQKAFDLKGDWFAGYVYAKSGERAKALQVLDDNLQAGPDNVYTPILFGVLGDLDSAFEYLERAYNERHTNLVFLKTDALWDSLRDDPRFDDLLRRIGFETDAAPRATRKQGAVTPTDDKIRLAVLPFADMSPDPQVWFSDGMTSELIATLGKIEALGVISRTSAFAYKDTSKTLPQIARELSVTRLVEGSVLRIGETVRIDVTLLDATTDLPLWSNRYEQHERDVLALQNEVALAIAEEIEVALTPRESIQLASAPTVKPAAYQACLLGQHHWNQFTAEGYAKAREYFELAIREDPSYAAAQVWLGNSYGIVGLYGAVAPKDALPKAKEMMLAALAIDDTLPVGHASLGMMQLFYDWDWFEAEKSLKRAIELNPSDANSHHWYGLFLTAMGRHELAIAEAKLAQAQDPLSAVVNNTVGRKYYYARRYDEAISAFERMLELHDEFLVGHEDLAKAYLQKGMFNEAFTDFERAGSSTWLGYAHAVAGNRDEALAIIDALNQRAETEYVSPYRMAVIWAGLNEKDEAFTSLEQAFEDRSGLLVWLNVEPVFDPLRDDPRFDDLLRRIGF